MHRSGHGPDAALEPAPLAGDPDALRAELRAARREAEEYRDLLLQARADCAAARRRLERQRAEQATQVRIDLLVRVLPILDELERGLDLAADLRPAKDRSAMTEAIRRKLRAVLEAEGIERIDALGALYNPWEHEAIQSQASPELEDQRILAVVREGYRIGDRVIRPAQVVVARRGG